MFVNLDDFLGMGKGYYGVNVLLRGRMGFNEEARNMDLNTFSSSYQIKKKMFDDCDDFLGMGRGYGDTFTLLRGLSDYDEEERNIGIE